MTKKERTAELERLTQLKRIARAAVAQFEEQIAAWERSAFESWVPIERALATAMRPVRREVHYEASGLVEVARDFRAQLRGNLKDARENARSYLKDLQGELETAIKDVMAEPVDDDA